MSQSLAHLQMFDYLLKKYRNRDVFPNTRMIIEIDGKLWTGDFLQLDDCHILEIDWDDTCFTQVKRSREAINDEFDQKIQLSNVNVSQNRIDAKINKLKHIEILYQEITYFVAAVSDTTTSLKPYLYHAFCLDTHVKLPFLDVNNKKIKVVSLTK